MQIRFLAPALAAALAFSPLARAGEAPSDPSCPAASAAAETPAAICAAAPREFKPESQVRGVVENFLRYRVTRVGIDGGCYEVLASDSSGTAYSVRFRGADLRMVSRHVVKDEPTRLSSAQ